MRVERIVQEPPAGLKGRVFALVGDGCEGARMNRLFEAVVAVLVLVSVGAVFASTFELSERTVSWLRVFERVASAVFTFEYAARLWTADLRRPGMSPVRARLDYAFSFMALVDLVAILPFWIPVLFPDHLLGVRAIRLLWLFRVFKLNRYFTAMATLGVVLREKRRELFGSAYAIGIMMLVSSLLVYVFEHDAQPEAFRNALSGLWWAVVTLTTVGYGDLCPVTPAGRVLGGILALLGIAAVAIPAGIISSGLTDLLHRRRLRPRRRKGTGGGGRETRGR